MSININPDNGPALWATNEKITSVKLNQMCADAANTTDDIHPQYAFLVDEKDISLSCAGLGADADYLSRISDLSHPSDGVGTVFHGRIFREYSFKKSSYDTLRIKFNLSSQAGLSQMRVLVMSVSPTSVRSDISATTYSTTGVRNFTVSLSGASSGDLIKIFVSIWIDEFSNGGEQLTYQDLQLSLE
jgi:hypothetical protein